MQSAQVIETVSLARREEMSKASGTRGYGMRETVMYTSKVPITAMEQNYRSSTPLGNLCWRAYEHLHFITKP